MTDRGNDHERVGWVVKQGRPGSTERARGGGGIPGFENLILGAGHHRPAGGADTVPEPALAWLCRGFGNAAIRRAYADWRDPRFGRYEQVLANNGVDLVQIGRFTSGGHKNAADIRRVVDAMETLMARPDIQVFLLVTGDSDFTPLVHRLREFGKHVVGVGPNAAASTRLTSVCSEYRSWDAMVERAHQVAARTAAAAPAAGPFDAVIANPGGASAVVTAAAASRLRSAEQLMVRAFEHIGSMAPTASALKSKMVSLDPAFTETSYGCRTFRELLTKLSHRVIVTGRSGSDITVSLLAGKPGT